MDAAFMQVNGPLQDPSGDQPHRTMRASLIRSCGGEAQPG
jgi:hypothetical protein